jgi:sugar (pentulose or hexulose) kinase
LASGTGYGWLSALFGWEEGQIDRQAARDSVPGAHGLVFAPYLAGGEQGALWNPRLRGAVLGLNLSHTRADIARAYLEGVFFEVKRCLEVLAETLPVESVRVGGKIVHAPESMQMLADILERGVAQVEDRSPAAIGAALLARRLISTQGAATHRPPVLRTVTPDATAARIYRPLYADYVARAARCE